MQQLCGLVLIAALFCCQPVAAKDGLRLSLNPIRRVVTLLQQMQAKVTAEGKKEEELFEKFMCYCKTGAGDLEGSISAAETKIPQLESAIEEKGAELTQLTADIEKAKADKEAAKAAVAEATALREKEAAAYAKDKSDMDTNIAALKGAIAAIEKGMAGAFLQSTTALRLRKLSINMDLSSVDRDVLSSFLTGGSSDGYVPQSGQIVGILKQMLDTMQKDLADAVAAEESAVAGFESLIEAKTKEINALTNEIETKLARKGEAGVELVNMKEDLEDTTESLGEDKAFLANLEKSCSTKEAEWAERSKMRAQELLALADTIKILNDDDSLELFKKTLPSPSLIQMKSSNRALRIKALGALNRHHDHRIDLIALTLQGKKVSFAKVISMIDDMVKLLKKEQEDDDLKKSTCEADLDKGEDTMKELDIKIADLGKATEDAKEQVATLTDEISALEDGIKALDKQVSEATETRKEEHEEYVEDLANNNAAIEILGVAKNRLYKFYAPKLYVPPPKVELSAEESIYASFGGAVTTAAPGGIAGTGVTVLDQTASKVAPPPPPETWGAYKKKGEESSGVIAMVDILIADLEKEVTEMETEEKDAQTEYEEFMKDSSAKRAADSKSLSDDESAKAELEATLVKLDEETKSKTKEAMATAEYIKELHGSCDWLLENFEARKAARAGEVESLTNAKAVLSGADYSFVQMKQIQRVNF